MAKETNELKNKMAKPRFNLVPANAHLNIVKILEYGATKHGPHAWRKYPIGAFVNAIARHLNAIQRGEWVDDETGLPHVAHISCSCMFLDEIAAKDPEALKEWDKENLGP